MVENVAQALAAQPETWVQVRGKVADAGGGWLAVTDVTGQIYAWGLPFSGDALVTGSVQRGSDGRPYLAVQSLKRVKRDLIPTPVIVALVLLSALALLCLGLYLSMPDFDISDIIGPKVPPANLTDAQKDRLTAYKIEATWHDGPSLCAEMRNVGKIVIAKEDLERISFSVNNETIAWNKSGLPLALGIRKRFIMCLCTGIGEGCPENSKTFLYEKAGDTYPSIAFEIRPPFGSVNATIPASAAMPGQTP